MHHLGKKLRFPPMDKTYPKRAIYLIKFYDKLNKEFKKNLDIDSLRLFEEKRRLQVDHRPLDEVPSCYSMMDLYLVLTHTFLYMLVYYGNAPTSSDYTKAMNISVGVTGVIQAVTPALGFVSVFFYNWFAGVAYRPSYIVSFLLLILGLFLYAFSYSFKTLLPLILGRMMLGFGAARGLTKKFFTNEIKMENATYYAAILTGVSNSCISLGPGLSSLLIFIPDFNFFIYENRNFTVFTFVLTFCFLVLAIIFFSFFKDTFLAREKNKLNKQMKNEEKRDKKLYHGNIFGLNRPSRSERRCA